MRRMDMWMDGYMESKSKAKKSRVDKGKMTNDGMDIEGKVTGGARWIRIMGRWRASPKQNNT